MKMRAITQMGDFARRMVCAAMLLSGVQAATADDSYLLWMVDDYPDPAALIKGIDGSFVHLEDLSYNGNGATHVRVKQISGGTETYLNLYDAGTSWGGGSDWPLGIWDTPATFSVGSGYAVIPSLGADPTAVRFMIEIGNYNDLGGWDVLAYSDAATYQQLENLHHIWHDELDDPSRYTPWQPTFSVPEPSSGLLLLLGGAMMVLRRRRREIDGR